MKHAQYNPSNSSHSRPPMPHPVDMSTLQQNFRDAVRVMGKSFSANRKTDRSNIVPFRNAGDYRWTHRPGSLTQRAAGPRSGGLRVVGRAATDRPSNRPDLVLVTARRWPCRLVMASSSGEAAGDADADRDSLHDGFGRNSRFFTTPGDGLLARRHLTLKSLGRCRLFARSSLVCPLTNQRNFLSHPSRTRTPLMGYE
jgi:hypothetical protein